MEVKEALKSINLFDPHLNLYLDVILDRRRVKTE